MSASAYIWLELEHVCQCIFQFLVAGVLRPAGIAPRPLCCFDTFVWVVHLLHYLYICNVMCGLITMVFWICLPVLTILQVAGVTLVAVNAHFSWTPRSSSVFHADSCGTWVVHLLCFCCYFCLSLCLLSLDLWFWFDCQCFFFLYCIYCTLLHGTSAVLTPLFGLYTCCIMCIYVMWCVA